ncbi:helix-turn-helix domain-containing protein [Streptomyces sp. NPDC047002]|uniref:TetR/AcrR family transcriptional regulator n=1 Tax=Streptomyces sp. NPDC047002 TaxID=3155475 RepID=UPI0034554FB6
MSAHGAGADGRAPLRADAARNRAQILEAARDAFRERGTAVPMDEIARRAGVNIATLYRRFPDRDALVAQVLIDGFTQVLTAARDARERAPQDALGALEDFLLRAVEARDELVLPLIGGPSTDSPEALELQREIAPALAVVLDHARAQGTVRADVTPVDLITAAVLACRPLPLLPADQAAALAARHVRVFLDGLRPHGTRTLPQGPTPEQLSAHLRL